MKERHPVDFFPQRSAETPTRNCSYERDPLTQVNGGSSGITSVGLPRPRLIVLERNLIVTKWTRFDHGNVMDATFLIVPGAVDSFSIPAQKLTRAGQFTVQ